MFQLLHEDSTASFAMAYLKLKRNWVAVFLFDKSGNPTCNQNVSASAVKHSVHEGIGKRLSFGWVEGTGPWLDVTE